MYKEPKKEVEEGVSKDQQNEDPEKGPSKTNLQQKTQRERRHLKFQYNKETHGVTYDTSHTVIGALNTNPAFKHIRKTNQQKEIVIIKDEGKGAAVNTDFPCELIKPNETLKIAFISNDRMTEQPSNTNHSHSSEDLLSFNVKTRGGERVRFLMRNNALVTTAEVDYVCVYALKGETFKTAVKRDSRFSDIIFGRSCALSDIDSETIHQMSEYVDDHNNKKFKVIVDKNRQCQDSQDTSTSAGTMTNAASHDASENTGDEPRRPAINTEQVNTEQRTSASRTPIEWKPIEGSREILKLLREQYAGLQEQLKHREELKDRKKFFRAEYDKSVQSFLEVKKVREIMRLCDSVCQIRRDGSARGTGFLLFDRFILTNAHVIGECHASDFTAVFGYEDLDQNTKHVPIKDLTCFFKGKDDEGNHLDYALLELKSDDDMTEYPQLLPYWRQKSLENGSLICIVGHPEGQVKKMDPCFVIGIENRKENADEHVSKNVQYYHVISENCLKEKWGFHKNQITYDSCFFHGSSGSPVFDADGKLIGIHTGGWAYKEKEAKTRSVMEYAYDMQPILDDIKAQVKGRQDIINILEGKIRSDVSSTAEQQNHTE